MHNTAQIPDQEFIQSPMQAPELVDLLLPSVAQQERVSELLDALMSNACNETVDIASQSEFVFTERRNPLRHATHG